METELGINSNNKVYCIEIKIKFNVKNNIFVQENNSGLTLNNFLAQIIVK